MPHSILKPLVAALNEDVPSVNSTLAPPSGAGTEAPARVAEPEDVQYSQRTEPPNRRAMINADQRADLEQMKTLANLIEPHFARRPAFWLGIASALAMGGIMGGVALGFFNVFEQLARLTWNTDDYASSLQPGGIGGRCFMPIQRTTTFKPHPHPPSPLK